MSQEHFPSIPSPRMDHSPGMESNNDSFCAESMHSDVSLLNCFESASDDLEVEDEGQLLMFISKLQLGIANFLHAAETRARPVHYNKMGNPAPRTKRQHEHDIQKSRKAYREQGYADIGSFFQKQPCAADSDVVMDVCGRQNVESVKRWEEEEEDNERDVVPMTGTHLREEEEESEEEDESKDKGLNTAPDPQSIARSLPSGLEKDEKHSQHVPRVTIDEIEDEDCGTLCPEHGEIEELKDEDESNMEEELNCISSIVIHQARARPPMPTSPTLKDAVTVLTKRSKAKTLDVIFRGRLNGMLAFLRFYMSDQGIGWREASLLAATAAGKGAGLARSLRVWVWEFLEDNDQLPESLYGQHRKSRIEDEDLAQEIHLHLQSLNKRYLKAVDIIQYLNKPEVKSRLGLKETPSERTARQWMHAMDYRYGKSANGMYVDGHEHEDVVNYRTKVFLPFWTSIEDQMVKWSNDNEPVYPQLFIIWGL